MKILARVLIIVASAGLGLAAGFAWRARHAREGAGVVSETIASRRSEANRKRADLALHGLPLTLAGQLRRDLTGASEVNKWLCWMAALEKAKPEDYAKLAQMAHGNPAVWRFVVRRWVKEAPKNLFDTLAAEAKAGGSNKDNMNLARQLFNQWTKDDPNAVIAALNSPDGTSMQTFRMEVAGNIINQNAELGLQLFQAWNIDNYGPDMGAVTTWADANPQHAAEFALAHPCGYASQEVADTIGTEWAKNDPTAALNFALGQSGDLANRMAAAALKQWAGQDLGAAGDWLANADEQAQNSLSAAFVEMWAKQDAASALSWSEQNLQGIQLQQAVTGVMNGATAKDVTAAAAIVTSMDPGEARTEAAGVVAQKWLPNMPTSGAIQPAMVSWISSLDPASIQRALDQVTWSWAESDPKGIANFISSISPDEVPSWTDNVVEREWIRTDPANALAWAATLPGTQALTVGNEGFSQWRGYQPDAANAWLEGLPMSDARRQAFAQK